MKRRRSALFPLAILALLLIAGIVFALGPVYRAGTESTFNRREIGDDAELYLKAREAAFPDLRPSLAKRIVWADPQSSSRTRLSIVYIHGFSASPLEIKPVPERIAAEMGANLFLTRLAGHGRSGAAMGEASVQKWVDDFAEAMEIGRRIGERVLIIGTSSGGSLATWGAAQTAFTDQLAGLVLISPNYGIKTAGSRLLTLPWGQQIAELIMGKERGFTPQNALHEAYWTSRYPTSALLPMAALTQLAWNTDVGSVHAPALFIYSPDDTVVRAERIAELASGWGGATELLPITTADDPDQHVLAGDALSPSTTDQVIRTIVDFARRNVRTETAVPKP